MNTRKIILGTCAGIAFLAASCTQNTADDGVYENGVDKTLITKTNKKSVDKTLITKGPSRN